MSTLLTKHFQYSGTDDYDIVLDDQINAFLRDEKISKEQVVDVKYEGHSALGVNTYSALLLYTKD